VSPAVILPMTRASLRLGVVRMGVRSILGTYSDMGAATFSVMTKRTMKHASCGATRIGNNRTPKKAG